MLRCWTALLTGMFLLAPVSGEIPSRADSYYQFALSRLYQGENDFQQALLALEKAVENDPDDPRLRYYFARTLLQAQEIRKAVEQGQKATELDPEDPEPLVLLGQIWRHFADAGQGNMLVKSIGAFEKAIELDGTNAVALFYLGDTYFKNRQYKEAAETLARFAQYSGGISTPFRIGAAQMQARALVATQQYDEAITVLEKTLELDPADASQAETVDLLGRLYEQAGEDDKALQQYQTAIENNPSPSLDLRLRMASVLSRLGKDGEAVALLEELSETDPEDVEVRIQLGRALLNARNYQRAVDVLTEVMRARPEDADAGYYLASGLRQLGRRADAIATIEQILTAMDAAPNPADESVPRALYRNRFNTFLAVLYQDDRQFDRAVALFRELSEEEPDSLRIQLGLLFALNDAGLKSDALELSDQLLNQQPNDRDVLISRAQILSSADRLPEAIQLLMRVIDESPTEESYYIAASQLHSEHRQFGQAEDVVQQGLRQLPESESLRFQLAAMQERQGNIQQAEEIFRSLLESNPDNAGVLNYLGYMLADRGLRLEEALGYIEKAIALDPYNGAYLDSLGWVYFKLDRLEKAEKNLVAAARLNDTDPTILEHLGDLYRRKGDYSKARVYYEKSAVFAVDPDEKSKLEDKLATLNELISSQEN